MFGGNAFQLTLFLVADLVAGQPVLPAEGKANQVRLGGDSVQSGLLRSGTDWWNDCENDQLSKR